MLKDAKNSAIALYDGGWRAKDREWLAEEHGLLAEEVEQVCIELKKIENKEENKMLKERIEKAINKEVMKRGIMGTEEVNITLNLTDTEKEYFLDELSDIYNYELNGNQIHITWNEE